MGVLTIDAGTSSCKVGVFSETGLVATAGSDYIINSPQPGYAELDAADAWQKMKNCVKKALAEAAGKAGPIRAVSFSSMGEAMVPVTLEREVVGPCLLSYDVRGGEYADKLLQDIGQEEFFTINPNAVGPYFSMPKMLWIKDHLPEVYAKADVFILLGDFIGFMMGARPYATNSLANRTLLLDIRKNDWSNRLLDWAGFPREKLGPVVQGGTPVGTMSENLKHEFGLTGDILLVAGGHDQCCNSLGCGCTKPGMATVGLGTFETYCPSFSWPHDVRAYLEEVHNLEHHVLKDLYVSFLYNHSGLMTNWFISVFAADLSAKSGASIQQILDSEMPDEPTNILFLPHNEPPQWPVFDGETSGVYIGLKIAHRRGDMFKAMLEGNILYFVDAMDSLEKMGMKPDVFIASGGGSRSDARLQLRADILNIPIVRLETGEGSLTGAAILAATRAGIFASYDQGVETFIKKGRTFEPDLKKHALYRQKALLYKEMEKDTLVLRRKLHQQSR